MILRARSAQSTESIAMCVCMVSADTLITGVARIAFRCRALCVDMFAICDE